MELYERIEQWMINFYRMATEPGRNQEYYVNAASGLGIALQEIDKERYMKRMPVIWQTYLDQKKANGTNPVSE